MIIPNKNPDLFIDRAKIYDWDDEDIIKAKKNLLREDRILSSIGYVSIFIGLALPAYAATQALADHIKRPDSPGSACVGLEILEPNNPAYPETGVSLNEYAKSSSIQGPIDAIAESIKVLNENSIVITDGTTQTLDPAGSDFFTPTNCESNTTPQN